MFQRRSSPDAGDRYRYSQPRLLRMTGLASASHYRLIRPFTFPSAYIWHIFKSTRSMPRHNLLKILVIHLAYVLISGAQLTYRVQEAEVSPYSVSFLQGSYTTSNKTTLWCPLSSPHPVRIPAPCRFRLTGPVPVSRIHFHSRNCSRNQDQCHRRYPIFEPRDQLYLPLQKFSSAQQDLTVTQLNLGEKLSGHVPVPSWSHHNGLATGGSPCTEPSSKISPLLFARLPAI